MSQSIIGKDQYQINLRIIITFSGHSRRFKAAGYKLPKFLIKIDGQPIIKHVLNMFGDDCFFDLIFNKKQILKYPNIKNIIEEHLPKKNFRINEINSHELGPAYSVSQLKDIKHDENVLISYCDYLVQWNYKYFINSLKECDGAIPAFKGFHPASFGNTYYAYMKLNSNGELKELREKKSFTNQRQEEPASIGMYYFKKWSDFQFFYKQSIQDDIFKNHKEHYISLVYNQMVKNKHRIKVPFVKKFVCLGTPEDLDQYLNWHDYFKKKKIINQQFSNLVNLIPMAGNGKRFKDYGYNTSKPLIQIDNTPMVIKSCSSFPIPERWVFIIKKKDNDSFNIAKKLGANFKNYKIITVNKTTSGQAATCLYAKDVIDEKKSIFVASADYELFFNQKKFLEFTKNKKNVVDVVVFTKKLGGNLIKDPKAFGYCVIDKTKKILKIVEKNTISTNPGDDPLVVGSFWFKNSKLFFELMDEILSKNIKVNNEHYIANGLNLLIKRGYNISIFEVDNWISFGDPFELELYYYWSGYFNE